MTKARNIADLLDANGDVKSASLDNVPAVDLTNLSATNLTSGTIPNARITLDANEIPNISTDKLTSGTIPDARLPSTALNSNVDLATTLTTQGDLLFRDGSGLTRLAKGTHGQHLVQTGSHPAWTTPAVASSDYVKLADYSYSGSGVNSFNFQNVISSTYKSYYLKLGDFVTGTAEDISLRFLTGTNTEVSSNDYNTLSFGKYMDTNGSGGFDQVLMHSANYIKFAPYWGANSGNVLIGSQLDVWFNAGANRTATLTSKWSTMKSAGNYKNVMTGGHSCQSSSSAYTGITLYMPSSGTITNISCQLYGLK